jgi:aryl-phospho-beta-D-glucosidase BglC (GH1 family)
MQRRQVGAGGRKLVACVALALAAVPLQAAERERRFVHAQGREIVGPDGAALRLKGIGLGNWLLPEGYMFGFHKGATSPRQIQELFAELVGPDEAREFWTKFRDAWITRDDIRFLKRAGFDSVRVPFNYRLLTPEDQPGTWLPEGFARLDDVVAWSRAEGLWVVLDMHGAPGGQTGRNIDDGWGHPWLFESEESQARTVAIWRKLAERYRDEPAVLGYDLLNEPLPNGYEALNPRLEPLYRRLVAAIREVDPNHLVLLGGARWNTDFSVFGPPFDPNLAYTFHKYWNQTDDASIQAFLAFRERHGVPIWLGESGENDESWIAACIRLMDRHGIGWCFWPYKKMDSTRGVVSVARPAYWDEVVAYAEKRGADFELSAKIRPPVAHARQALAELLEKSRLASARVNEGYLHALGLHP